VEVSAPEALRVERLRMARGGSGATAQERIDGQVLPPVGWARAHWRIENDADLVELTRRADRVWDEILELKAKAR
jgi:dephospho-CoA kinase